MYLYCIKEVLPKLTLLFSSCAYPCECASLRVCCADQVWSGCAQRRDGFGPDKCADRCKLARTGQRKLLRAIKAARAVIDTGVTELLHLALHPTDHPRKVELNILVEEAEALTSEFQRLLDITTEQLNWHLGNDKVCVCVSVCPNLFICWFVPMILNYAYKYVSLDPPLQACRAFMVTVAEMCVLGPEFAEIFQFDAKSVSPSIVLFISAVLYTPVLWFCRACMRYLPAFLSSCTLPNSWIWMTWFQRRRPPTSSRRSRRRLV